MIIKTGKTMQHTFEVVDKIPPGFFIWNIGDNMDTCDYIPICEKLYPGTKASDPLAYHINTGTLKAVPLNRVDVLILRKAAGYGINSVASAKKALRKNVKTQSGKEKRRLASLAIDILTPITE